MTVFLVVLASLTAPAGSQPGSLLPTGAFAIVPGESTVEFAVPDNRGGFTGRTTKITGRLTVAQDAGGDYAAQIAATIDAGSITTQVGVRDTAMRTVYLRTAQFPDITFAGTAAAHPGLGVKPFAAEIRGRLTVRDVTRDVQFTATVTALATSYMADATTTVRMADYQIPYPRAFIFVARDPVTVTLHVVARRP
jgi:polyisoprenoid-binding protein YceI